MFASAFEYAASLNPSTLEGGDTVDEFLRQFPSAVNSNAGQGRQKLARWFSGDADRPFFRAVSVFLLFERPHEPPHVHVEREAKQAKFCWIRFDWNTRAGLVLERSRESRR